jgi:hypothetical protein
MRKLVGLLAAVILLIVGLILFGMRDDEAPRPDAAASAPAAPRRDAASLGPRPLARPAPSDAAPAEVRDHRTDVMGDERPQPAILPETVAQMRPLLLATVKQCAWPLRSQTPVQKGRLMVTLHIKAKNGKARVADIGIRQDMVDDAAMVECVRKAIDGAVYDAAEGQEDGEQDVTMAFPIP